MNLNNILRCFKLLTRCKHNGKMHIKPPVSLITDCVNISGSGFEALSPITVKATAQCEAERLYFTSHGNFITSENGSFDVSTSKSFGGSYFGVDDMGLFWSMKGRENDKQVSNK